MPQSYGQANAKKHLLTAISNLSDERDRFTPIPDYVLTNETILRYVNPSHPAYMNLFIQQLHKGTSVPVDKLHRLPGKALPCNTTNGKCTKEQLLDELIAVLMKKV